MRDFINAPGKFVAKFLAIGFLILLTFYISPAVANAELSGLPLAQIIVEGNDKTQTRFILKWARISVSDVIDQAMLDKAKQNLLDSGLFKQVTLTTALQQSKPTLTIQLEEKIFTLLLPRFSRNGDGDLKLGINLKLHNINGANQTLNLLAEKSELSNGDDGRRYRITYDLPQYSQPYSYHFSVSDSVNNTLIDNFRNVEYRQYASVSVTRDWHIESLNYPLSLTTTMAYEDIQLESPYPEALNELDMGKFNRFGLEIRHDAIHTQVYRRYGYLHSLRIEQGVRALGSDYVSQIVTLESRFYKPLNEFDNFNTRLLLGSSKYSPFNTPYYELGGSGTLRGLDQESVRGDLLLLGNFEYVIGLENHPSFRWSSFIDIGHVYPDYDEIDLTKLQTSVGLGLRWKALSFVDTDLFIDYAYNIDTNNTKIYAGTLLTF